MRRTVAAMVGLSASLVASSAMAQEFGQSLDMAFSADRLFAIHFSHRETENPGEPDIERDRTGVQIGWGGRDRLTPFDVPRFAFDIFVIDGLSVGGALGFASMSDENQAGTEFDASEFIFAPRVGYVWMFSEVVGFWLRGGFTYHSASLDGGVIFGQGDEYGFAFTADPTFVFSPVQHLAFLAGINADLDLMGEVDPGAGPDLDRSYRSIGIQVGLLGWI